MTLDEGNRDGESVEITSNAFDGARRISRFGESVADSLAEDVIFGKADVFAPSDVVRVDEKRL